MQVLQEEEKECNIPGKEPGIESSPESQKGNYTLRWGINVPTVCIQVRFEFLFFPCVLGTVASHLQHGMEG